MPNSLLPITRVADIRDEFARQFSNLRDGDETSMLEILGASFVADEDIIFGKEDKDYIQRELEWYGTESLNIKDIKGKIPQIWQEVADPRGEINSNYGFLLWSRHNGNQLRNVLTTLREDPKSRRAVAIYTRPSMHSDWNAGGMKDFICTNAVQYQIRDEKIHCTVQMRSNDAVFGFKNDLAWQKHILTNVFEYEFQLDAAPITWQVGNLHVYPRHRKFVKEYLCSKSVNE